MVRYRLELGVLLGLIVLGVFLLFYQGQLLMSDERTLFDSAQSFVRRGEFYPTYEYNLPGRAAEGVPWAEPAHEPLPIYVAALFTAIGYILPGIGMVHSAVLMNIIMMALVVVSFYAVALLLGYSVRSAFITALLLGVASNMLPYSRMFFREPQMAFFLIWCFGFAILLRQQWVRTRRIVFGLLVGFILALMGALLTKIATLLLLPGFALLFAPGLRSRSWRWLIGAVVVLLVFAVGFFFFSQTSLLAGTRYSWDRWEIYFESIAWNSIIESVLGYQISPGRSIWLHTPLLFVALWGAWRLIRQGRWRMVAAPAVMILTLSIFYGLVHRNVWWGGWGWGPRYFTPLLPLMFLWLLPILQMKRRPIHNVMMAAAAILGVVIQVIGLALPLSHYYTERHYSGHALFNDPQPWMAINWSWELGPLQYHLTHLGSGLYDGAWTNVPGGGVVLLLSGVLILLAGVLTVIHRRLHPVMLRVGVFIGAGFAVLLILWGLYVLRDDSRYTIQMPDVRDLITQLNATTSSEAAVFIDEPLYIPVFMNWLKTPELVVTLDYSPGEDYGDGPQVISDQASEQIGFEALYALDWTAEHRSQLWLVASSSPFQPEKIRPVERYLAENFFPVQEIFVSDRARAIRFFTGARVDQFGAGETVAYSFGDAVALTAYNLPLGQGRYQPGDVVPLTLLWQPQVAIAEDYNISVQIATPDGFPLVQRDGQPQGTFGQMSQWQPGDSYLDHHGLQLPPDIPPGDYMIQVIIYRWQDGQRLPLPDGGDVARLTTISVAAGNGR